MLPPAGNAVAVEKLLEHSWKDHFLIPISITLTVWDLVSDSYMAYAFFAAGELSHFVAAVVFIVVPGMMISQLPMMSDDPAFGGTKNSWKKCIFRLLPLRPALK
jgi:hypothetical protein